MTIAHESNPHALQLILADTFFDSLDHLEKDEQLRALSFVQELRRSTKSTGASLERIRNARSKNLWSGRITRDLRAILHREGDTLTILHAAHHDPAYRWAERRDIGRHPVTGAFQIVETVETVREVEREVYVEPLAPPLFAAHTDAYLLSLGVPESWVPAIREVRTGEQVLELALRLPPDVGDRLLLLADGQLVTPPAPVADRPLAEGADPRAFLVVGDDEDLLSAALGAPFDRWIAFLHPTQRQLVEKAFSGPAKVSGSAGTGKTVVAMHRARHLARQGKRVLLTTFVKTLCANIERNLRLLCTDEERAKITVSTLHSQALALARATTPRLQPATDKQIDALLGDLAPRHAAGFDLDFITAEWRHVIVPQGITGW
ncbi:MAG: ATP-dependent helicase, partial [Myxococcales bacterium]|nr:ATP-dependent helicase [Myxococcales bacterium]